MSDVIRVEGLGTVSLLDLVERLSKPPAHLKENDRANAETQKTTEQNKAAESRKPRRKSVTKFNCTVEGCTKGFCTQAALNNHINRHNREFKCSQCSKVFNEHAKLKRHQLVHTGERPFKCPFAHCQRRFSLDFNLTTHMRIHTGDKPFKCDECGKCFAQSANLKQHKKTHENACLKSRQKGITKNPCSDGTSPSIMPELKPNQ
ncbi:Oidioi.mRNA.OKI2018_I69.PAR.g11737.t1.cds [Oikopleura dioica]|uniref:Oidioi.mRNA.OKI2018_I69.PAR.g11737.t1.cds n=1 Tax=Oikopleura dioica TaxID=34765 RepID=A0ABN7S035_OIKDI|nr:Oidioi.mRNA.OKI2018_I69.PAR.g11737.t1.cds [Oikopleura dioica]